MSTFNNNDKVIIKDYENPWQKGKKIDGCKGTIERFQLDPYDPTLTRKGAQIKLINDDCLERHITSGILGKLVKQKPIWIPLNNLELNN